jgi:hypothetical protein
MLPSISAIRVSAFDGGRMKALVRHSRFQNLNPDVYDQNNIHLSTISVEAITNSYVSQIKSKIVHAVEECEFYENGEFPLAQTLTNVNENSSIIYAFKQNIVKNYSDVVVDFILGGGVINGLVEENYSESNITFYTTTSLTSRFSPPGGDVKEFIDIEKNKASGASVGGFVGVFPSQDFSSTPFSELLINIEKNCFEGVNFGEGGSAGVGVLGNGSPTGNIIFQGSHNNFVGMALDILDQNASATYLLAKNYWGPSGSCSSSSDCGVYQVCHERQCAGPQNIYTTGGSMIDVGFPLEDAIKCHALDFNFDVDSRHSTKAYKQLHLQKKAKPKRRNPQYRPEPNIQNRVDPKQKEVIDNFSKQRKFHD